MGSFGLSVFCSSHYPFWQWFPIALLSHLFPPNRSCVEPSVYCFVLYLFLILWRKLCILFHIYYLFFFITSHHLDLIVIIFLRNPTKTKMLEHDTEIKLNSFNALISSFSSQTWNSNSNSFNNKINHPSWISNLPYRPTQTPVHFQTRAHFSLYVCVCLHVGLCSMFHPWCMVRLPSTTIAFPVCTTIRGFPLRRSPPTRTWTRWNRWIWLD